MAKSMTGYGRCELEADGKRFTVEIKSVNNRYLDLNIHLPRQLSALESGIRNELNNYLSRGKVEMFVSLESLGEETGRVTYNREIARAYVAHLKEMQQDFDLPFDLTVSRLAGFPDVLTTEQDEEDAEALWEPLKKAVDGAAKQFAEARTKEGSFITNDLLQKLDEMQEGVDFITRRAPGIVENYRAQLSARMQEVLQDTAIDEQRILQEAAIYSDKVCIDEELVRLNSHISAVRSALKSTESVGRKLDFLAQEMNREANTILSKTDDEESASRAIELKTVIEKIREQIQNIE